MSNGAGHLGTGRHKDDIHEATKAAWEDAKKNNPGLQPGVYECKISIDAENPIRSYVVTISQP
jgi:hypothetical protein